MSHEGIVDLPSKKWKKLFARIFFAMFYLCKAALPKMETGGAIINTASIQAYEPDPSLMAYAATKGAIVNFTKSLNKEAVEKESASTASHRVRFGRR
jgi:NAD(P)-dependent dehydrogenase (short-subunit alcohol dehydrogenase family)